MTYTHDHDDDRGPARMAAHPGPNRPDPDTGWRPGMPALVLFAGEDGAIVYGWRLPAAFSPEGVILAIADETDEQGRSPFPLVDPAAWHLVSTEHAPERPHAGVSHDLAHDLASGGSEWQGRSAAPPRPAMEALARETDAAQAGARGAALELAAAVRNPDGSWRDGADLYGAIAGWLGGMGVSPADVPIPAAAWAEPGVLRAVTPKPPDGSLTARHRWVCSWALTVQARIVAVVPGCVFHGTPAGPGTNVAIESATGRFLGELANTGYRHSPTGFAAGYEGSGAAALARSLLTAALGSLATCPGCLGSGRVTYLVTQDAHEDPVPWQPAHDTLADPGPDPGDGEDAAGAAIVDCPACDGDGIRITPAVYQEFKRQVIGRMDGDLEWRITRGAVLAWLITQGASPALAALASAAPIDRAATAGELT